MEGRRPPDEAVAWKAASADSARDVQKVEAGVITNSFPDSGVVFDAFNMQAAK